MTYKSYLLMTAIGFSTLGGLGVAQAGVANVSEDRIKACITNTCGSPQTNMNSDAVWENINQTASVEARSLSNYFEAGILYLSNEQYILGRKRVEAFAREISKDEPINLSTSQRVLFALSKVAQGISGQKISLFRRNPGTGKTEVIPEVRDAYFATLGAAEANAARVVLEEVFLKLFDEFPSSGPTENMVVTRMRVHYPSLSMKDALMKDADLMLQKHARLFSWIGEDFGRFLNDELELQVLRRAAQGEDLDSTQIGVYEKVGKNLTIFSKLLVPTVSKVLEAYPLNLQADIQKMRDAKFVDKKKKELEQYSAQAPRGVVAACQTYLRLSLDGNTSELRIRKFQPVIAQVKAMAKIVVAQMTDSSTRKELEKFIDDIQFSYPTTNKERMATINSVLEIEKMSVLKEQKEFETGHRALIVFNAFSEFMDSEPETLMDKIDTKSPVRKACEGLPFSPTSDYAVSALGKISVSWYSLAFPDRGASILAHEIGHVVSTKLRTAQTQNSQANARFSESLSCVANRNPFSEKQVSLKGHTNTTWSEEDWADHFSTLVMAEFSKQDHALGNAPNLGCTLVDNSKGSYGANKLEAANGSHSKSFLRLLLIGQDRKQLTPDCQSILEEIAPNRTLQCH